MGDVNHDHGRFKKKKKSPILDALKWLQILPLTSLALNHLIEKETLNFIMFIASSPAPSLDGSPSYW